MLGAQGKLATEIFRCAQEAPLKGAADPGGLVAARLGARLPGCGEVLALDQLGRTCCLHPRPCCHRRQRRAPPALCVRVSSFRVQRLPKTFLLPMSGNGESPAPSTLLPNPGDPRPWMRWRRMGRQRGCAVEHFHQCSRNHPLHPTLAFLPPSPASASASHPYAELCKAACVRPALGSGSTGSLTHQNLGNNTRTQLLGFFLLSRL